MIADQRKAMIFQGIAALAVLGTVPASPSPGGGPDLLKGRIVGQPAAECCWLGVLKEGSKASSWNRVTDGHFSVRRGDHSTTLLAICKDRVPLVAAIQDGVSSSEVELRPSHGSTLDGVVRSDDGRPLEGATIRVLPRDGFDFEVPRQVVPSWETSAAGAFAVAGLQSGLHGLELDAEGHIPTVLRDVVIREEGGNRIEIELHRAFFVSGHVLDEERRPVVGAAVEITSTNKPLVVAIAGAGGAYRAGPFKRGETITIQARSPALGTTKQHRVVVPHGDLNLIVHRRVVRGLVIDGMTGKPLERFRLRVFAQGKKRTHAVANEGGVFTVPLHVETYAIAIEAHGRFPWFSEFATGDVGEYDLGTIALDRARAITGRVLDARSGAPIAHATAGIEVRSGDPRYLLLLSTRPERAKADQNGVFLLGGLPDASVNVNVVATGYVSKTVRVDREDGFIEVALDSGATVAGSLVLPDGTPATGFATIANVANGNGRGKPVAGGTFQWDGLGDGEYEVSAESDAGAVDPRIVRIRGGQSVRDIRLVAMPLGAVRGTITGLFPGEEATVQMRDEDRQVVASGLFRNGAYSLRGVPAGVVTVNVYTTAERSMAQQLRLGERAEEGVDLDFTGRSRLRGIVTVGVRPLGAVRLTLTPENRSLPSATATTSELGQYVAQGLADGRYVVRIRTGHRFEVDIGHDTVLDIRLPDISLAGTVVAAETGKSIVRAWVELARVNSSGMSPIVWESHVAGDGGFRIDGLAEGDYIVRAIAPDYQGLSRRMRLTGAEFVNLDLERR